MIKNIFKRNQIEQTRSPHKALRGMNLGGWLVLEKWITPSLFKGLSALDEYSLSSHASPAIQSMLDTHRKEFIAKHDFEWLADQGIQTVRLPVGYWVFGDEPPYFGAIDYVDKAFEWAEQTGLSILLDLHGAPGSQNGKFHSGKTGESNWHTSEVHIIRTLRILARLAERYAGHPQLLGIELLNEPGPSTHWSVLRRYYHAAYHIIRETCGPEVWVVVHDGFRPRRWRRRLKPNRYPNLILDTHQYRCFSWLDKRRSVYRHIRRMSSKMPKLLHKIIRAHPVVIGEWSLALNPRSLQGIDTNRLDAALKDYGTVQLQVYDRVHAWYFWTYKTEGGGTWSYRDLVERGLL